MNTNCPHCGSKQTQARDVAYKTGSSETKSSGTYVGFGFGRRRGSSTWFGRSTRNSTRQSLFAKESEPFPLVAPFFIIVLMFFIGGQALTVIFILGWLLLAISANWNYEDEWVCRKCGTKFIPSRAAIPSNTAIAMNINEPVTNDEVSISESNSENPSNPPESCRTMNMRSNAKAWLAKNHPSEIANPMRASKYYGEQELWFFTFPTSFLNDPRLGSLVILLEDEKSPSAFHFLKVPFAFFRENRAKFDTRKAGDKFDLHISARSASWMHDLRSQGIAFSQFCS